VAKFIEGDPSIAIEIDGLEDLSDLVLTNLRVHLNHSFEELALSDLPSLVLVERTEGVSQGKVLVHQALIDLQNGRNDIFWENQARDHRVAHIRAFLDLREGHLSQWRLLVSFRGASNRGILKTHILEDSLDSTGASLFLEQVGILTDVDELLEEEVIYLARLW
jgi:hypothetical protein